MSYLNDRITTEEFIKTRGAVNTQKLARWTLHLFDLFTKDTLDGKSCEQVVLDLEKEIAKDGKNDRLFILTNKFIQWLQVDHEDIIVRSSNHDVFIRKHTSGSIRLAISIVRAYYEEFGQIDFPDRKFRRRVKLPKKVQLELYPLSKEEIRQICDRSKLQRRAIYMILKDTGLRISEVLWIKKDDFNFNVTPVSLDIRPNQDKTNSTNQTRYITSETREYVELWIRERKDEEYLFIKNTAHHDQALNNEERIFDLLRKKLGFTKRYEHNNRHKITIHSFRAFTITTLADKYGEEFAHGYVGHSKYLGQYVRNRKKYPEMFLRIENEFMLYKTVEIIDESQRVNELEQNNNRLQHDVTELKQIMQQLSQQKDISTKLQLEIQKLKK